MEISIRFTRDLGGNPSRGETVTAVCDRPGVFNFGAHRAPPQKTGLSISVLLAFVHRRGRDAILDSPDVNHDADPIENEDADSKSGRGKRGQKSKNHRDWCYEEKKHCAGHFVTLINVAKAWDDTEQDCHRIARLRFRRRGRLT